MELRSAEECIAQILQDIENRRIVDYSNKKSVQKYNRAFDRIFENANYLCVNYPDKMHLFMDLIENPDYGISSHCTSVLFRLQRITKEQKRRALLRAKQLACDPEADEVARMVWRLNIDKWETSMDNID